ncbi:hypothetical protein HEP87_60895 [Streptomyces sp. S1D4-11]
MLAEWWWNRQDKQPIHSWATYIGKTEQYTEYYGLRLDRGGRLPGGVNGGEVLFRDYYDLRADPYQLTDKLHGRVRNRSAASASRAIPTADSGPGELIRPDRTRRDRPDRPDRPGC